MVSTRAGASGWGGAAGFLAVVLGVAASSLGGCSPLPQALRRRTLKAKIEIK
jgi:hypothetical protein